MVKMNKKMRYFHEVWPEEERILKLGLEESKRAKAERQSKTKKKSNDKELRSKQK